MRLGPIIKPHGLFKSCTEKQTQKMEAKHKQVSLFHNPPIKEDNHQVYTTFNGSYHEGGFEKPSRDAPKNQYKSALREYRYSATNKFNIKNRSILNKNIPHYLVQKNIRTFEMNQPISLEKAKDYLNFLRKNLNLDSLQISLSAGGATRKDSLLAYKYLTQLKNLKKLHLEGDFGIDNKSLEALLKKMPKLKDLKLSGFRLDPTYCKLIADNCNNLETLGLINIGKRIPGQNFKYSGLFANKSIKNIFINENFSKDSFIERIEGDSISTIKQKQPHINNLKLRLQE